MIEAVMLWNEPNNLSHWDFHLDPEWKEFGRMTRLAAEAVRGACGDLPRALGGISPIDPNFVLNLRDQGVLDHLEIVAVHGFPLDWNHWPIDAWPEKLSEIRAVTDRTLWVTETGVSTFGAEEVQEFGLVRTAELLVGATPRVHWYSLFDLPRAWPATTRHKEAEGSSYYRHFYMGLLREDGTPKRAVKRFAELTPALGICQWLHFEDHRLDDVVRWLRRLGVRSLRTGLSWADSLRPGADAWFDRQMRALDGFDVTVTFCFTPDSRGRRPDHTSPPERPEEFAEFCARMARRYAKGEPARRAPGHAVVRAAPDADAPQGVAPPPFLAPSSTGRREPARFDGGADASTGDGVGPVPPPATPRGSPMRVLITGAAGFVGSHLTHLFLARGHEVWAVDNLSTGRLENLATVKDSPRLRFRKLDVSRGLPEDTGPLDAVLHFASPASPVDYLRAPLETMAVCSEGTRHALDLARRHGARFLLASTSEVYGDPLCHPQREDYWGNVNPVGPRSVYDEAKRFAEAMAVAYERTFAVRVSIARIFNTYGPGMRARDGRVVSNFIVQALRGEPLTVHGDGTQTRSLCFVSDLVRGLYRLLLSGARGPVNLGNPQELTVMELAMLVGELCGRGIEIVHRELPVDDPRVRRPDISRARELLGWNPRCDVREGLARTIEYFRRELRAAEPQAEVETAARASLRVRVG